MKTIIVCALFVVAIVSTGCVTVDEFREWRGEAADRLDRIDSALEAWEKEPTHDEE